MSIAFTFTLLASRIILFLIFQVLIALILNSWLASEKYWLLTATLTNVINITLLLYLFKRDGKSYLHIFKLSRSSCKKDLTIFLILTIISIPVLFVPGYYLGLLLWNDANTPTEMMFGYIERWLAYILLAAFPLTIAMAELAMYFGYIMPKLREQLRIKWLSLFLSVLFLSIQHCTLPFIPDLNFIVYRALAFLPFATLIGISILSRPTLFPYFAILHGVIDFGTALMFL